MVRAALALFFLALFFLALFFLAPVSAAAQLAAPLCSIDGSVVNAVTGQPVPRAVVTLSGRSGQYSATATATGQWTLESIDCGPAQVTATRPGFLQGVVNLKPGARTLMLVAGEPFHDAKVSLQPQVVVTGKVVDEVGDPAMFVEIAIMTSRVVLGRRIWQPAGSMATNDLGEYRLASLQAGKYIVCAHPGGRPDSFRLPTDKDPTIMGDRCYPGPLEGGAGSAMDVAAGTTPRVDFALSRVPAVRIRGVLAGAPRGVGLSLSRRVQNGVNGGASPANLGPDGKFEIRGVASGSYLLASDYWDAGKRLFARLPLEVGGADIDGLNVKLEPAFPVTGTVRIEAHNSGKTGISAGLPAAGPQVPAAGPQVPAAGPQVNVTLVSRDPMAGAGPTVWNASRDSFTINDLTPGSYRLEAGTLPSLYLKSATLGGRDMVTDDLLITQAAGPIEVVFSDDGGTIQGQVEDGEGRGVGSWVMIVREGRKPYTLMSGTEGSFSLGNLAPGRYEAYAWDDIQQVEYADPEWMRRNARGTAVTVEAGQTASVKLERRAAPVP